LLPFSQTIIQLVQGSYCEILELPKGGRTLRALIDTNVLIPREDHGVLPKGLRDLFKAMNTTRTDILVHPRSLDDLRADPNIERRQVSLSKLSTYSELESPPDPTVDDKFVDAVGPPRKRGDEVDNALLYAVYRDAVDLLITEDQGIHKKARRIGVSSRVLSVSDALSLFREMLAAEKVKQPPALKVVPAYELKRDDPFFESLKDEYPEFDRWFEKICREGRPCLVHFGTKGCIDALLIWKTENEAVYCVPPLPKKPRLKICTLKVDYRGRRLGELFIKLSTFYAIRKNLEEIYLTHFTKPVDPLADLLNEYGFSRVARTTRGEGVYLKVIRPSREDLQRMSPEHIARRFWPLFYDGPRVKKFIVPIRPEYHERLFVDYQSRQTLISEHLGEFIIEGNTIKKAYLCHSRIKKLSKGDVLLFYRSRDKHEVTSVGTVEDVHDSRRPERIMEQVRGRTVYTAQEIRRMVEKPTLVVSFIWHCHLSKPLPLKVLVEEKIVRAAPMTITQLSETKYLRMKMRMGIDGCLTVN